MNKERKKQLAAIADRIDTLIIDLEMLRDEEQAYFDNMPESFKGGEKGEAAEEAEAAMSDALNELESAKDHIEDLI
jgi:hypothetical protein